MRSERAGTFSIAASEIFFGILVCEWGVNGTANVAYRAPIQSQYTQKNQQKQLFYKENAMSEALAFSLGRKLVQHPLE